MVFLFALCKLAAHELAAGGAAAVVASHMTRRLTELATHIGMMRSARDLCVRLHILVLFVAEQA